MSQPFDINPSANKPPVELPEELFDTHEAPKRRESPRQFPSRPRGGMGRFFSVRTGVSILILLLIGAVGGMLYFYNQANQSPEAGSASELKHALAVVGKLMVLPQGETPTVATVSDPLKLQDQPFFAKAQKGDIVLIYPVSHKAILYNPTLNKIVEVAPINLTNQSVTPTPTTTPAPTPAPKK